MGWNNVWDTTLGAGWSHQVEIGSNKELIASLQEYDFVGGASEANKKENNKEIETHFNHLQEGCSYLNNLIQSFKSSTFGQKPISDKKKYFEKTSASISIINRCINFFDDFIKSNKLYNGQKISFEDKKFDVVRETLHAMKEFDETYDPNHQNTFLSRGINLRNLAFMGIKLTSKTENTAGEIEDTLREDTQ